jgi:hypothetical protein
MSSGTQEHASAWVAMVGGHLFSIKRATDAAFQ